MKNSKIVKKILKNYKKIERYFLGENYEN